jgi:hypothetical protein
MHNDILAKKMEQNSKNINCDKNKKAECLMTLFSQGSKETIVNNIINEEKKETELDSGRGKLNYIVDEPNWQ